MGGRADDDSTETGLTGSDRRDKRSRSTRNHAAERGRMGRGCRLTVPLPDPGGQGHK